MDTRRTSRKIGAIAAIAAGAALTPVLCAGTSLAAPPSVVGFDVAFVDDSCGSGLAAMVALHVQFTDNVLPDGSVHHWIDLSGDFTNEAGDRVVSFHAARRFTDSATGESSVFRGLQAQFSAAGVGVLAHTSGWSDGALVHGRWDATPTSALPPAVCTYLFD
jgi:hypothetical protein